MDGTARIARSAIAVFLFLVVFLGSAQFAAAQKEKKGESNTRNVNGQVVDKAGNPLPKAVVYLRNAKTLQIRTYIANEGGNFHFQGLSSNIDYQLHAEYEGLSSPVRTISSFDARKEIQVSLKIPR